MSVTSAESTELFVGTEDAPRQVVRVGYTGATHATPVRVTGAGLTSEEVLTGVGDGVVEVGVLLADDAAVGRRRAAVVHGGDAGFEFTFVDAEPGWTMFMVSHFHYDPVWWNTQAAYTSEWTEDPPGRARQTNGFELVSAHLEMARRDPDYKFVLAEVDYLKPYWDTHPQDRDDLRRLVRQGRVEIMGGTYNEPNTNLTSPETAIRNFVAGIGFQRDILGAEPSTAWQLDVFGHDPQFPGMAADAGLTSSSWARGPHHQWGPMAGDGDPERMQFASEFEWIAPSGVGLLTHYMPAHYSAGWWMDSSTTLAEATAATWELFRGLKKVAATRNVLLPVGTDYTPPNKWVTEIMRFWAARYCWPKFVCALPREFFAAVRAELDARGAAASPQTRDMNPIYTGKDVSFIDTKQANRAAEAAVLDAERFAVFAHLLAGVEYPEPAFAKAWVQLAYGAHHDAITGSESDQVYLDLLTGWRDAWEIGSTARDRALAVLTETLGGGPVTVWNPLAHNRTDVVTLHVTEPGPTRVIDDAGRDVPVLVEDDGHTLTWLARDVPALGWRSYRLAAGRDVAACSWRPRDGVGIANAHLAIRVDPARGGGVVSVRRAGSEWVAPGRVANELAVYEEYSAHPQAGEGPWHLLPRGPVVGSGDGVAEVSAHECAIGQRLVVHGRIEGLLRYTQTLTLWDGIDRVDCRTTIDEFTGSDRLLRLRWPLPIPGAVPVSEVGDAVIGRGFGLLHQPGSTDSVDTAVHPWTLENPAHGWFGLSSAVRIRLGDSGTHAVAVAEVVTPAGTESAGLAREVLVALVRAGVTATCSGADRPRYGHLDVDSNLPDTRIAIGGPDRNAFTAAVLAAAGPGAAAQLQRQLDDCGTACVFVPPAAALADVWVPDADLRAVTALPVLIIAGRDDQLLAQAVAAVAADLEDSEIAVPSQAGVVGVPFEHRTAALLNRGVPSFAVDTEGTLHTSLLRSCTGWPSGVWTTHEKRTAPDGSNFQLQHWSHTFDYAVIVADGDWREAGLPLRSAEHSRPLVAVAGASSTSSAPQGSLLGVDSPAVNVDALKLTGNPTPSGRSGGAQTWATLRLVETLGRDTSWHVTSDVVDIQVLGRADLLERLTEGPRVPESLHGYEIATVVAELTAGERVRHNGPLAPEVEAAQPLYARYWLHNRGPAPLGGLPAVAHLHPHRVTATDDDLVLRLTVASDCTDADVAGRIEVVCPPGWIATPGALPVQLKPGAHREAQVRIAGPTAASPGWYPVRAQLTLDGDIPRPWRQTVEDVCLIAVGEDRGDVLRLESEPSDVVVAPGCSQRLTVRVGTDAHADLAVEAHLISPWGTWEWLGPAAIGAVLPARGGVDLVFDVAPPAWVAPGQWWALVRVAAAGELLYTPAVRVVVR
ncbi:NEW3 domain-containing protein [Mycobacterium sp. ACS4331]|uniref:glycoside hydrolase family 38 N-terminal domain-containing protein n=1 Tax=Mycobacterium sp. ACS4331 TaxID=1834121 RepID=UPI00080234A0|nr:NEW3 domain-containing protein [Mycobacterium sp. ACS4331]OBF26871.1 alpha-mannosidase [Mycobacterium sp. ACS4331]